jgi:hypothetical protein
LLRGVEPFRSRRSIRYVSYDFAVWEGESPKDAGEAGQVFAKLCDEYVEKGASPPTPNAAFVQSLLAEHPDLDEVGDDEESPWAVGHLIGEASGPLVYFAVVYSRAEEMQRFVAASARQQGLVCFDPQIEELLT